VKDDFVKFPTTPHLALLEDVQIRNDKVLSPSEREAFLRQELIVEEKVDGANLGISFDAGGNLRAQNRGTYLHLPGSGQWKHLGGWLAPRTDRFFEHLTDRYILFGEWCYAKHSVWYDQLPDWFLAFDIYDKSIGRFLSVERRDEHFRLLETAQTPFIARGKFTLPDLLQRLTQSGLSHEPAEGLYLRIDDGDWLLQRAKLVRPAFIQSMEHHWARSTMTPNRLKGNGQD
jgi:hypothetical protein